MMTEDKYGDRDRALLGKKRIPREPVSPKKGRLRRFWDWLTGWFKKK